ncbi:hypothetical protein BLA50215_07314 [Burkholderia lata]|uniref:hypothetical protein n=1 Tax=Burkholderia lata (strain ATCC 17760 / DSM 23089 / LMG 22485 / NCIMB 9086 / R18194 / 383) TaxID=482957 RepID=UPI001454901E|nr:hypothetical protein [Burkholderia lata]VWD60701.1 hypothetical protein BLA50215_07314 [Burkholderia lata]
MTMPSRHRAMQTRAIKKTTVLFALVTQAIVDMSRQCPSAVRATVGLLLVASVFSGCAPLSASAPADPQQQFAAEQRNANALYSRKVLAYKPMFENPGGFGRAQILEAYEAVLQQYSVAAIAYARTIYPEARQTLPPSLQPLPSPSGPVTLAVVNRDYEHVLGMDAALWEMDMAANFGRPSRLPIPKYTGPVLIMPPAPPFPPLQDVRDPKFARLVTMTKKLDDAQKADLAREHAAIEQQYAEQAAWRARHPTGQYDHLDPRTGLPYAPPQQETQRWCMMGGGRVPC